MYEVSCVVCICVSCVCPGHTHSILTHPHPYPHLHPHPCLHPRPYVGLARTIYIRCIYGTFGRKISKYTVIYGVYIRFWPTLPIRPHFSWPVNVDNGGSIDAHNQLHLKAPYSQPPTLPCSPCKFPAAYPCLVGVLCFACMCEIRKPCAFMCVLLLGAPTVSGPAKIVCMLCAGSYILSG